MKSLPVIFLSQKPKSIDEFSVSLEETNANITDKYYVKGEKRGYYGNDLLKHALHNTVPDITKTVQDEEGNDIKVRDAEAIQLADAKINEIRSAFTSWLNEQLPEFKRHLADMYNRKFNCYVRPEKCRMDAKDERRRYNRPSGRYGQNPYHVHSRL